MNETAIFLVLLSAAMHALRNFFTKKALDKPSFIWWYEIFGLLFFTPVFVWVLASEGMGVLNLSKMIFISGMLHFLYWVFLAKSLENGDLSMVYPIMRSSPALVLVFSVAILGERVSSTGIAGILLVAVGPWVSMALFSLYLGKTKWSGGAFIREWACNKTGILLCGILSIFGYFLILAAFTLERVSYIVGLRQLSIVFAVLLGGHFLKEESRLLRIVSSIVIFLGADMIAVSD